MMFKKIFKRILAVVLALAFLAPAVFHEGLTEFAQAKGNNTKKEKQEVQGEKPQIIEEVVTLRNENSKSYFQSNGNYLQVSYTEPIHYWDGRQYREMDNRLKKIQNGKKVTYQNKKGAYQVRFPDQLEEGIEVEVDGMPLSLTLLSSFPSGEEAPLYKKTGINNTIEESEVSEEQAESVSEEGLSYEEILSDETSGEIQYESAGSDTTIVYNTYSDKIKESIFFDNKEAVQEEYTYQVEAGKLNASQEPDGTILFYKKSKDNPTYRFTAPFMFDSSEEPATSYEIRTTLEKKGSSYTITYTPSKEWLQSEERVYPVILDPSVEMKNVSFLRDTYISSSYPNQNFGTREMAEIEQEGRGGYLFKCDLFPIGDNTIISSKLYLRSIDMPTQDVVLGVKRVISGWSSGYTTWNTRPTTESGWLDYANMNKSPIELDITRVVKDYTMQNERNYGVMVSRITGDQARISTTQVIYENSRPYVVTEYSPCLGDYEKVSTHNVTAGRGGTIAVNDFTGRAYFESEDLGVEGNRMPVSIKRVKTENQIKNVGFGGYFRTNYNQKLITDIDHRGNSEIGLINEHGGTIYFYGITNDLAQKEFSDKQDAGYTLIQNGGFSDYANYIVETPEGYRLLFNAAGNLTAIQDDRQKRLYQISITYCSGSEFIDQITDGVGGKYKFEYNNSGTRIIGITYTGEKGGTKRVTYSYTEGAYSEVIVNYPDGNRSRYGLMYTDYITYIINETKNAGNEYYQYGKKVAISYYIGGSSHSPVIKIQEYGKGDVKGDSLSFTYEPYQTKIEDANGNYEIYQFNRDGDVTGVRNQLGEAVFASYGGEGGLLLGVSRPQLTGDGSNLITSETYTPSIPVTTYIHDSSIPVLSGRKYQQVSNTIFNNLKKTYTVKGNYKKGDTFTFSGWLKGIFQAPKKINPTSFRDYSILVTAKPKDPGVTQIIKKLKEPNLYVTDWQYLAQEFTLDYDSDTIEIELIFDHQAGTISMSNFECQKKALYGNSAPINTNNLTPDEDQETDSYYDEFGNLLGRTDPNMIETAYEYDEAGNQISEKINDLYSHTYLKSSVQYDSQNNLKTAEYSQDLRGFHYTYDNLNHLETKKMTNDSNCPVQQYRYNSIGNQTKTMLFANDTDYKNQKNVLASASYTYNNEDQLSEINTETGMNYQFSYYPFGDLKDIKAGNQTLATYNYQSNSNRVPTEITYGNGQWITYEYNSKNQLIRTNTDDYFYHPDGTLSEVREFGKLGRYKKFIPGKTLAYGTNNVFLYEYENKAGSTTFTKDGLATKVTKESDTKENLSYGNVSASQKTTTKDRLYRITGTQVANSSQVNLIKKSYHYRNVHGDYTTNEIVGEYTKIGTGAEEGTGYYRDLVTGDINQITYHDGKSVMYSYDKLGQLTRVNDQIQNKSIVYTYDKGGNILNRKEYLYTTGTLGSIQMQVDYTYGNIHWKDQLTVYGNRTIRYDGAGNPTYYLGTTMTWEKGRQLSSMAKNNVVTDYKYDHDGYRYYRSVTAGTSSVTYDYDYVDGKLMAYTSSTGNKMTFTYDQNGIPWGLLYNGAKYYYQTNLLGDVVGIVNDSGMLVATYAYDAWGKLLSMGGSQANGIGALNPMRYRGYVYDNDTGWYYVASRYYDPEIGRFLNADEPKILKLSKNNVLGSNIYAYCYNNPVNRFDPTGHASEKSIWSFKNDWAGRAILLHYLYGNGKEFNELYSEKWAAYMMANEKLRTRVSSIVKKRIPKNPTIGSKSPKDVIKHIKITTSMMIENGEDIIGYQYLHGSNETVGGFEIEGDICKTKEGGIIYYMHYAWNDIIDPNLTYISDKKKSTLAKYISFGRYQDYTIHIRWYDKSVDTSSIPKKSIGQKNDSLYNLNGNKRSSYGWFFGSPTIQSTRNHFIGLSWR